MERTCRTHCRQTGKGALVWRQKERPRVPHYELLVFLFSGLILFLQPILLIFKLSK
ncbi:hypothetical protein CLONEX_03335 [[Clostridium] nexile DSM 1787]|nr:hypothetical protein CLONEX_03335 [[Clostridium] nexile DSM 1787]